MVSSALNGSGNSDIARKIRANIRCQVRRRNPRSRLRSQTGKQCLIRVNKNEGADGEGGISPARVQAMN